MTKKAQHQEEIQSLLSELTDEDLLPYYQEVYKSQDVSLDDIERLLSFHEVCEWDCLTILSNSCKELKADYNNYLLDSYGTIGMNEERLSYLDIATISQFVVRNYKLGNTACFEHLFSYSELILKNGNDSAKNLIVVGFFEGIQNISGWHKVDYYTGFDKWLQPESKKAWHDLIELWESE